jgi:hypothetical protein
MNADPDLKGAVAGALSLVLKRIISIAESYGDGALDLVNAGQDARLGLIDSPEFNTLTEKIFVALREKESPFVKPSQVAEVIIEQALKPIVLHSKHPSEYNPEVLETVVDALLHPVRAFTFSAPLSCSGNLSLDFDLGGPSRLRIVAVPVMGLGTRLMLTGEVQDITTNEAFHSIEELLTTLLGLSMALGIARIIALRSLERPSIKLNDGLGDMPMDGTLGAIVACTSFGLPGDLNDIEAALAKKGEFGRALESRMTALEGVLTSHSDRAVELKASARLLFESCAAREGGKAITYAFMSMEASLLERNTTGDILSRLREAVAYRLGKTNQERRSLRGQVKELYGLRSEYVHTGRIDPKINRIAEAQHLACSVLRKELVEASTDAAGV